MVITNDNETGTKRIIPANAQIPKTRNKTIDDRHKYQDSDFRVFVSPPMRRSGVALRQPRRRRLKRSSCNLLDKKAPDDGDPSGYRIPTRTVRHYDASSNVLVCHPGTRSQHGRVVALDEVPDYRARVKGAYKSPSLRGPLNAKFCSLKKHGICLSRVTVLARPDIPRHGFTLNLGSMIKEIFNASEASRSFNVQARRCRPKLGRYSVLELCLSDGV
jgi:hypothetical protein